MFIRVIRRLLRWTWMALTGFVVVGIIFGCR